MIIGVPKEIYPGERRVALVPAVLPMLTKAGFEVQVQSGAGLEAGYPDSAYQEKGAKIVADRAAIFAAADIIVQVLCYGANDINGPSGPGAFIGADQILVGFLRPFGTADVVQRIAQSRGHFIFCGIDAPHYASAKHGCTFFHGNRRPAIRPCWSRPIRIRIFPMLTTAAGTVTPARVFVIGCGVAGLQALATARRLGAVISAYDLRPAAKEQVQSLGGALCGTSHRG